MADTQVASIDPTAPAPPPDPTPPPAPTPTLAPAPAQPPSQSLNLPPIQLASLGAQPMTRAVAPPVSWGPGQAQPGGAWTSSLTGPLAYASQLQSYYQQAGQMYGVDPRLLKAVAQQESGQQTYDAQGRLITSSADAQGIMQFIPETATKYGVDVTDPKSSIFGGAHYLSDLIKQYGSVPMALQAYNGAQNDSSMKYSRSVLANMGVAFPEQQYLKAEQTPGLMNRGPSEWGRVPSGGYGEGPGTLPNVNFTTNTGMNTLGKIIAGFLGLGMIMSGRSALGMAAMGTAFGSFVQGYQNGQIEQAKLAREQFETQLEQHRAQIQDENQEIGSAMAADPTGQSQTLWEIAGKWNDGVLRQAIGQGPDAINKLMQARDHYGTDLNKTSAALIKAKEEEQKQQEISNEVAAKDQEWRQQNPNATLPQIQEAHFQHLADAQRAMSGKATGTTRVAGVKSGNFSWTNPDGTPGSGFATYTPGVGLTGQDNQPIPQKAGTFATEVGVPRTSETTGGFATGKPFEVEIRNTKDGGVRTVPAIRKKNEAGYFNPDTGEQIHPGPGEEFGNVVTQTGVGGGLAAGQAERQITEGREAVSELKLAANMPIGTTVGLSGTMEFGTGLLGAVKGAIMRGFTPQDQRFMQQSMAGITRELTILMSPVYGTQGASDLLKPLLPAPGDGPAATLNGLAMMRRLADNALATLQTSRRLTSQQQNDVKGLRQQLNQAMPWTPEGVQAYFRQGQNNETYGQFADRTGIDYPQVNSQEEYDALPSGAKYRDSHNNIGTKP